MLSARQQGGMCTRPCVVLAFAATVMAGCNPLAARRSSSALPPALHDLERTVAPIREALLAFKDAKGSWPRDGYELGRFARRANLAFSVTHYRPFYLGRKDWGDYEVEVHFTKRPNPERKRQADRFTKGVFRLNSQGNWHFWKNTGAYASDAPLGAGISGRRVSRFPELLRRWEMLDCEPGARKLTLSYKIYAFTWAEVTMVDGRITGTSEYSTLDLGPPPP